MNENLEDVSPIQDRYLVLFQDNGKDKERRFVFGTQLIQYIDFLLGLDRIKEIKIIRLKENNAIATRGQ